MVYADLRVSATSDVELVDFLKVCSYIQTAGMHGACTEIPVVVDGDGNGRMRFSIIEGRKKIKVPMINKENFDSLNVPKLWIGR